MNKLYAAFDGNKFVMDGIINPSSHVDARVLAAGIAEVHNIPVGAEIVVFSGTSDFYVMFDAAAAIPSAEVTDGGASMLNPAVRRCNGGATIGLISPTGCVVTMEFYN